MQIFTIDKDTIDTLAVWFSELRLSSVTELHIANQ